MKKICIALVLLLSACSNSERISQDCAEYLEKTSAIERSFIENIPIYSDYATPSKEMELRKYLLPYHLKAAKRYGTSPLHDIEEVLKAVSEKRLTEVKTDEDTNFYFYNVPAKNRFLTPGAAGGLFLLTERFQKRLAARGKFPPVKIAVSSMFRTVSYNKKLMKTNANANIKSTHSSGISFDIFFDDFYVKLPEAKTADSDTEKMFRKLKIKLGFLMGDALRRQFKTVLHETLTELQKEGLIYAIIEKRQRCYHVSVLQK